MQAEAREALRACIPEGTRLAVVHSSLAHLVPTSDDGKAELLAELQELAGEGVTLAFAAFTFSFCQGRPFHWTDSESETGVLADWILELPGAIRTPHPIYSYVVLGSLAAELSACANSTTFGDDSIFAAFEELDARIVMLGCTWGSCTPFHRYEELASVPYREFKTFTGTADFGEGARETSVRMFVRNLELDCRNDFSRAENGVRESGNMTSRNLWRGKVESAACSDVARASSELLNRDPWGMAAHPRRMEYRLRNLQAAASSPAVRIALLGSSNLHHIESALRDTLGEYLPDRSIEIFVAPFGQMTHELLSPESALAEFAADYTFFVDRIEDLMEAASLDAVDPDLARERVVGYAGTIAGYRSRNEGKVFVNDFVRIGPSVYGSMDRNSDRGAGAVVESLNELLFAELAATPGIRRFDLDRVIAQPESGSAYDSRLWFLGRFPFAETFSRRLATAYAGLILAEMGRTARVLIVDLDRTLWGGVVGEDGIEGLAVGGDYPGNAYRAFQQTLLKLSERGIALALASKNDATLAIEAIESLPGMAIGMQQVVAHRINWSPKWQNAIEICDELNLGVESAIFVDDNPVEREEMREQLPGMNVIELPDDPALYSQALLSSPLLECAAVTREDSGRVEAFKQRSSLEAARRNFSDHTAFLESLELRLHLSPLRETNLKRALQLIQKTNQFNTTSRRHREADLRRIIEDGGEVIVLGVEDKFSFLENMGVFVIRWEDPEPDTATIDSYLISCRALGKGIEQGALRWLAGCAGARSCRQILGELVATDRNTPAQAVFEEAGFRHSVGGLWSLDITGEIPDVPPWLEIVDQLDEGSGLNEGAAALLAPRTEAAESESMTAVTPFGMDDSVTSAPQMASPIEGLEDVVRSVLELDADYDLEDGGIETTPNWDSLHHIDILLAIEQAFVVSFSTEEIEETRRFSGIVRLLKEKQASGVNK